MNLLETKEGVKEFYLYNGEEVCIYEDKVVIGDKTLPLNENERVNYENGVLFKTIKDKDDELEYTTNPELIYEKWSDFADIIIDGGIGGIEPSTVVDCTSDEPIIIRQGKGELKY